MPAFILRAGSGYETGNLKGVFTGTPLIGITR